MMIQYQKRILQVVKRQYGATGEEIVQTEDGQVWRTKPYYESNIVATGDRQGVLIVDKVIE
jgi:hypothetical protein